MTELARFVVELLQTLWPLREVSAWCQGVRFWLNRPVAVLEPGVYWVVPYFGDVREVSVVPAVITTPMCTITLADQATCTYALSATIKVIGPREALCEIDDYLETSQELLTAIPAEVLSEVESAKLAPLARGRLLGGLRTRLNNELRPAGMEITALRFTNFVIGAKTYRLITDNSGLNSQW